MRSISVRRFILLERVRNTILYNCVDDLDVGTCLKLFSSLTVFLQKRARLSLLARVEGNLRERWLPEQLCSSQVFGRSKFNSLLSVVRHMRSILAACLLQGSCLDPNNQPDLEALRRTGENYSANSRCFESNVMIVKTRNKLEKTNEFK